MKAEQISEILAQYKKHGWSLRRVLLSDTLKKSLTQKDSAMFETAEIVLSEIDAAWFSRPSKSGEAWELRRLSENPYALFENFSDEDEEEVRAEAKHEIEQRLAQTS